MTITSLENGRWSKIRGRVEEALHQLNAMFQIRFETEADLLDTTLLTNARRGSISRGLTLPPSLIRPILFLKDIAVGNVRGYGIGEFDGKIDVVFTQPLVGLTLPQRNAVFTSLPVIP